MGGETEGAVGGAAEGEVGEEGEGGAEHWDLLAGV